LKGIDVAKSKTDVENGIKALQKAARGKTAALAAGFDDDIEGDAAMTAAVVRTITREELAALEDDFDIDPPIVEMKEGSTFIATLRGEGTPVETREGREKKDPKTGKPMPDEPLKTWVFESDDGKKFRILGAHATNLKFPTVMNRRLLVIKGRKKDIGQRQVGRWIVGTPKADGSFDKETVIDAESAEAG
jgi:hypothetical protein